MSHTLATEPRPVGMMQIFLPLLPHSGHEGNGRGYNWGTKAEEEYHGHWPRA